MQYLFLMLYSKLNSNLLIKTIKKILFKFRLPTLILQQNPVYFDKKWYKEEYAIPEDINPIIHYLKVGFEKGYNPSPDFDTDFYLNEYPDVKKVGLIL